MTDEIITRAKPLVLHKIKVASQQTLSASILDGLGLEVWPGIIGDNLLFQLSSYLHAEHLADETKEFYFQWPKSRWQRFKDTRPWWRRHFGMKYFTATATVEVKSWATFPESLLSDPMLGRPVYLQQVTSNETAL